jgi:cobalt-zinc-cadmium efflux system protein
MGHQEHNHVHHHAEQGSVSAIKWAFTLNLVFAFIELAGGLYTNSVAIFSDALHDFGDAAAIGVSYFLQRKSRQRADAHFTYGYKRFSLLGSLLISLMLTATSIFIIYESIGRILNPQNVKAGGMLLFAILGIVVNGAAVFRLKGKKGLNERSVYLHLMEDLLGWAAVLLAAIVLQFVSIPVIDPILSLSITCWVLFNVFRNLRDVLKVMLQASPSDIETSEITSKIIEVENVSDMHDFHLWSLDGVTHIASMHIVTTNKCYNSEEIENIKNSVRSICEQYGINHTTIETEFLGERCCTNCNRIAN